MSRFRPLGLALTVASCCSGYSTLHADGGGSSSARRIRLAVSKYPNNLIVAYQGKPLLSLFTKLRDKNTGHREFTHTADRILRLLAEEGIAESLGLKHLTVSTPCGEFEGLVAPSEEALCVVSIVRAGDALQEAIRRVAPGCLLGKILIQRDESTAGKPPKLYFTKLPPRSNYKKVILVDPMLATGNSAIMAIHELIKVGVREEDIVFLNVVACPEGLDRLFAEFPKVRVVTGSIDSHLDSNLYIVPGLGDFGDSELLQS